MHIQSIEIFTLHIWKRTDSFQILLKLVRIAGNNLYPGLILWLGRINTRTKEIIAVTNKNTSNLLINPNGLTGDHAYCLHLSFLGGNYDKLGVTVGILLVTTHHFNNKFMHYFILLLIDSDYQENGVYTKQLHLFSNTNSF